MRTATMRNPGAKVLRLHPGDRTDYVDYLHERAIALRRPRRCPWWLWWLWPSIWPIIWPLVWRAAQLPGIN